MCWRSLSYWRGWGPLFSLWSFSLLYLPSLQESWLHTSCRARPTCSRNHVQPSGHRPFVKSLLYRAPVLYRWFWGHFNAELWTGILQANKCHEWKGETSQSLSRTLTPVVLTLPENMFCWNPRLLSTTLMASLLILGEGSQLLETHNWPLGPVKKLDSSWPFQKWFRTRTDIMQILGHLLGSEGILPDPPKLFDILVIPSG